MSSPKYNKIKGKDYEVDVVIIPSGTGITLSPLTIDLKVGPPNSFL